MLDQILNLIQDLGFQHLKESICYKTLKRVQGDTEELRHGLQGEEGGQRSISATFYNNFSTD